jgi:hypothetical protein
MTTLGMKGINLEGGGRGGKEALAVEGIAKDHKSLFI